MWIQERLGKEAVDAMRNAGGQVSVMRASVFANEHGRC